MNIQHLTLLLFLTLVPYTHASLLEEPTYTVHPINQKNERTPEVTIKANPNTTIGDFRKLLAKKDDRLWLGRQGAIYSNSDNPFHNKQSLSTLFANSTGAGKNTLYIQYDDSIQPTFKFIYKKQTIFKKKLVDLGRLRLEEIVERKIEKAIKKEKDTYTIHYCYPYKSKKKQQKRKNYTSSTLTDAPFYQELKFKTKEQLPGTVCTIQVTTKPKKTQEDDNFNYGVLLIILIGGGATLLYLVIKKDEEENFFTYSEEEELYSLGVL